MKERRNIILGALVVALVSFGMFGPLIGLKTEQNFSNELILLFRPWHMIAAILGAVAVYVIVTGIKAANEGRVRTVKVRTEASPYQKWLAPGGLGALFLYPVFIALFVGVSGIPKWVDNFGILILIYVMLGWGLNIVVGLAGLLDLGYVAFYAIGSYSYALLS